MRRRCRCVDGWILRTPEEAGYRRLRERDTLSEAVYRSPGGARFTLPHALAPGFLVRQLCNCRRRAWRLALISDLPLRRIVA